MWKMNYSVKGKSIDWEETEPAKIFKFMNLQEGLKYDSSDNTC